MKPGAGNVQAFFTTESQRHGKKLELVKPEGRMSCQILGFLSLLDSVVTTTEIGTLLARTVKRLGTVSARAAQDAAETLLEMFSRE